MSDTAIVVTVLAAAIEFVLMSFAIFCIGFFVGFKREQNKILQKQFKKSDICKQESEEEQKAKKEWKKFISYDGSSDLENNL